MTSNYSDHLWDRPSCGTQPSCGTYSSCESYIFIALGVTNVVFMTVQVTALAMSIFPYIYASGLGVGIKCF